MTYRERRRHRRGRKRSKFLLALAVVGICVAIALLALAGYVLTVAASAPPLSSLKPIEQYLDVIKPGSRTVHEKADDLFVVIDAFWCALRDLNPQAFDEADDFVMLKTPGIFSLNRLCLSVMKDMYRGRREFAAAEFKHMLAESGFVADPAKWAVGKDEFTRGDAAKYGSMKGFAELGDLLYAGLRA